MHFLDADFDFHKSGIFTLNDFMKLTTKYPDKYLKFELYSSFEKQQFKEVISSKDDGNSDLGIYSTFSSILENQNSK